MADTTNIVAAIVALNTANEEKGFNDSKKAQLVAAKDAVVADIAALSDATVEAKLYSLVTEIVYALEMAAGSHDGSCTPVMSEAINAEYMHTEKALAQALALKPLIAALA